MKKHELIEDLKDIPDDADIVIGQCFVIDEKDKLTGVLDIPVVGFAYGESDNELRFMLTLENVKQCFHPKDVKFF